MTNSAFPTKKITDETLGEYLAAGRSAAGLSLERLADELSVSPKYLKALENNNFEILPPEVYTFGLLKRYCKLLNLEERRALRLFKNKRSRKNVSFFSRPVIYRNFLDRTLTYRNFIFLLIFTLLCSLGFYLIKTLYPLYTNPYFELDNPELCSRTVGEENIKISGTIKPEEKIWINNEEINPDKDGRFYSDIFLKEGENKIKIKVLNKFGRVREETCLIKKN